ncbi:MAG: OsmC family protein [Gemmatimonadaceae bacterium]|nr:OsmC family protein [Gemmatimonadaceae bacterium]
MNTADKPKPVVMNIDWKGEHRFDTARPGGPVARFDGSGVTGQSPVDALLSAVATCSAIDVVDILAKRRTPIETMNVEAVGQRVETIPRRYSHITLKFRITGAGIERDQALRAIELSVTKYCSVRSSLLAEIVVDWELELSGT